jgi:hypothetical protein
MTRLGSILRVIAGSIAGAAFAALASSSAHAECLEWNLNGYWEFQLENGRWIGFNLTQNRWKPGSSQFVINGKATYNTPRRADGNGGLATRLVSGSLTGNKFSLMYSVDEPGFEEHGIDFFGVVDPDGSLGGNGPTDFDHSKGRMNFFEKAGRKAACQKTSAEAEVEQNPEGRVGKILEGTQPPSQKDMLDMEQGPKIRDILKEQP